MRGIADIIGMLCSSFGNRLPVLFGQQLMFIYRVLPTWTLVFFYYFTATFAFQVTNIVTVLILANRFTAIAFPFKHKTHRKTKKNEKNGKVVEQKLLIYALLTLGGHALFALFLIVVSTGIADEYNAIVYSQYPWINDLCTLALSSWMLLPNDQHQHKANLSTNSHELHRTS
uniref:Vomeronasal type-1 receptor n=1 Tax=Globodera rostochiensis TaxID=31243 RepID=A0A914IBE3_GLORO